MTRMNVLRRIVTAAGAVLLASVTTACRTAPPARAQAQPPADTNAQTVVAEIALQKGDCRSAADTYAAAASQGPATLARRATEVSFACENMPAAWQSAGRWRTLAPADKDAAVMYGTVALRLYYIQQARTALQPLLKAPDLKSQRYLVSVVDLITQESGDATATFAALDDSLDAKTSSPLVLAAFGQLGIEAYNFNRADKHLEEALQQDANSGIALRLQAHLRVLRGDASGAIATARQAMQVDPSGSTFELAEVYTELDHLEEARGELERLRGHSVNPAEIDRRLALLAYESGDLPEAKHRFTDLVDRGEASDAALFYLADIDARSGDRDAALGAYRQLSDSSMALAACTRAAGILFDQGKRGEALELMDSYESQHPENSFDVVLGKAHLLADHGAAMEGVALLTAALDRFPRHPTLQYERAALLERAGHVSDSVKAFEQLLAERPDDPNVLNALGYTLADHNLELPRAEGYIRRALVTTPDNPAVLDSLAWVRLRRGDVREAVPTLERAYDINRDPDIAAHWGEALWMSGSKPQARQVWAAALARHPDSELLKSTLHRLLPPEHP